MRSGESSQAASRIFKLQISDFKIEDQRPAAEGCVYTAHRGARKILTGLVKRAGGAALAMAILAGGAAGQVPQPAQGSSKPRPQIELSSYPVFEFHSGFWINLHHALYEEARIREQRPTARPVVSADPAKKTGGEAAELQANGKQAWQESVDYYAANLAKRDLLFDGEMVDINNRLAEAETCRELSGKTEYRCAAGLQPELIAALERAAPVYRAQWWNEHDRINRAWISATEPLVREYGAKLAEELANVYHAEWPSGKIRVDVCHYAGLVGGYTSLDPLHITISGADERNQGIAALGALFHEASHGLAGGVRDALVREYRQREKPIPRDLWDAILLYTTAEFMKRVVASKESAAARKRTEGADRYNLTTRGWQSFQPVIEQHWKPYLDAVMRGRAGPDDFDRALARMVATL